MYHFRTVTFALLLSLTIDASAEILFEGIYSIEKDGVRTGYMIQRSEVKDNVRVISTYQRRRVDKEGTEEYQFTRSEAAMDFSPLRFSQRAVGAVDETMKADFKAVFKHKVEGKERDAINVDAYFTGSSKPARTDIRLVPPNSFLASFLYYMAGIAKMPVGKERSYVAFSEITGDYRDGFLRVDGSKKPEGIQIFQLQDFFAGEDIESFVFANGDPAGARNAGEKLVVYLVNSRDDAVKGFEFPQAEITKMFNDLPEGQKNANAAAGNKLNLKDVIKSFPVAKPTRQPNSEGEGFNANPDIKAPVNP